MCIVRSSHHGCRAVPMQGFHAARGLCKPEPGLLRARRQYAIVEQQTRRLCARQDGKSHPRFLHSGW